VLQPEAGIGEPGGTHLVQLGEHLLDELLVLVGPFGLGLVAHDDGGHGGLLYRSALLTHTRPETHRCAIPQVDTNVAWAARHSGMSHSREEIEETLARYVAVREQIDAGNGTWTDLLQFF